MNSSLNAIQATHRQSLLCRVVAAFIGLLPMGAAVSAQTAEVHLADDTLLTATSSPAPTKRLPVLFVHGHNKTDQDTDFNYQKDWQQPLHGLSFKQVLEANSGLGIEPYYIRFVDQARSITEDAAEIGNAIERILHRHDPQYNYPGSPTTHVQVVVIAYSKGTISTRQYLKSLQTERPGFRPVSEFIAIAPPNHGLGTRVFATTNSLSVQQLYNGYRPHTLVNDQCGTAFGPTGATDYIQTLNRRDSADPHVIGDTQNSNVGQIYTGEAPGSRADTHPTASGTPAPNPPTDGTLYVTLFDEGNRDIVGGDVASSDCQGRAVARNLAPDAVNIPVTGITDLGWETILDPLSAVFTSGEKKSVAVHQNTVHTPEVICQALYTAVHHRSPVGQTCTPYSNGIPVIPPPPRAAAMLTLDFSGSMNAPACEASNPGCPDTRASVLKAAVELFVQLWSAVSVPSDSIGVTYFRNNVTQYPTNGSLLPLNGNVDAVIADVRGQPPNNTTAMGGGLQRSIETLDGVPEDTSIRRVILFTDGMQNVNPMVQIAGAQLVIANQPSPPAVPLTVLEPELGIAVDTIGIGAADLGLLQEISSRTGGHFLSTTDPGANLRQFFVEELINALKGFSPQLVAYRRSSIGSTGSSSETFAVEDGPHRVVLKLSWKQGDSMDFSVRKDGVDVTSAGRFISGAFYKIFVIDLPKKGKNPIVAGGTWQIRIKGKKATAYETAAIVDAGQITYDVVFNAKRAKLGEPLDLVVRSTVGGKPIGASAKVTATLMIPTTAVRDLITPNPPKEPPAFEPGMTMAERQLLALPQDPEKWAKLKPKRQTVVLKRSGNGAFSTRLRPQVPGIYTAVVTIDGETAKIGKFSRTMTATTVVRTREQTDFQK